MPDVIDLVVAGGGAAGLACAAAAGRLGLRALVLERTERCGNKLALAGGRKGNFTHVEAPRAMADRFESGKRLVPILRRFPYQRVVAFFESLGIESRTDEEGCVWPKRADAAAIRDALVAEILRHGGQIRFGTRVACLRPGWVFELVDGQDIRGANACLATGGASYPHTGSSGDGLELARSLGLAVFPWFPVLASLRTADDLSKLAGVSQPLVQMQLLTGRGELAVQREATGHFLFAHEYVSGSSVLNLCGHAARALAEGDRAVLRVDWVPDRDRELLGGELSHGRLEHPKQQLMTYMGRYVPRRLAPILAAKAGVAANRLLADMSRDEQRRLVSVLKQTDFEITGTEPMARATATGGGVSLDEVDLGTMGAKRFPGLYCAGEVLDTWAETGGYNLHFAWATGISVAESISGKKLE
jgi:predicted Rossmann fold flavoprotein